VAWAGASGCLHSAYQSGQHAARLVIPGPLVGPVHPAQAEQQTRCVGRTFGLVTADHGFKTVVGHHGPLDLLGRRVPGSSMLSRFVPRQLRDIHAQDFGKGHQHTVAVYLAQAALDQGQPAFRPADQSREDRLRQATAAPSPGDPLSTPEGSTVQPLPPSPRSITACSSSSTLGQLGIRACGGACGSNRIRTPIPRSTSRLRPNAT
jgi:hypothetical protein